MELKGPRRPFGSFWMWLRALLNKLQSQVRYIALSGGQVHSQHRKVHIIELKKIHSVMSNVALDFEVSYIALSGQGRSILCFFKVITAANT